MKFISNATDQAKEQYAYYAVVIKFVQANETVTTRRDTTIAFTG